MKKIIFIFLLFIVSSCTDSPVMQPEATKAQAALDQVEQMKEMNFQLKRIADALEKAANE